ncbi:MAG: hypothetical protein IT454_18660 [Planctomycetes bacterium]|nr:hypothetical protein [Planctomycetota bacterium]
MKNRSTPEAQRNRRSPEELIQALQKRIEQIKARAEQKKIKANPALRHTRAALKSIEKAISSSNDNVLRKSLDEARATLSACLSLGGFGSSAGSPATLVPVSGRRSSAAVEDMGDSLLTFVRKNPGRRGEQIAADLGTDVKTMRLPMKKLIESGQVRTEGQRRGMTYFPA